jgi:hypothetical protein
MFYKKIGFTHGISDVSNEKEQTIVFSINNSLYKKYQCEKMNRTQFINLSSYNLRASVKPKENMLSSFSKSNFLEESLMKTPNPNSNSYFFHDKMDSKNLLESPLKIVHNESNSKIPTSPQEFDFKLNSPDKRKINFSFGRISNNTKLEKSFKDQENKSYRLSKNTSGNVSIWINKNKPLSDSENKRNKKNDLFSQTYDLNEYFSCYINESLNKHNNSKDIKM